MNSAGGAFPHVGDDDEGAAMIVLQHDDQPSPVEANRSGPA